MKTCNALPAGFGSKFEYVDIDRSNPEVGVAGFIGHLIAVVTLGEPRLLLSDGRSDAR